MAVLVEEKRLIDGMRSDSWRKATSLYYGLRGLFTIFSPLERCPLRASVHGILRGRHDFTVSDPIQ